MLASAHSFTSTSWTITFAPLTNCKPCCRFWLERRPVAYVNKSDDTGAPNDQAVIRSVLSTPTSSGNAVHAVSALPATPAAQAKGNLVMGWTYRSRIEGCASGRSSAYANTILLLSRWKPVYGEIEFECGHWAVFENAIDMAHIHYLHSDSFGNKVPTFVSCTAAAACS